jgi:hypothetical protein
MMMTTTMTTMRLTTTTTMWGDDQLPRTTANPAVLVAWVGARWTTRALHCCVRQRLGVSQRYQRNHQIDPLHGPLAFLLSSNFLPRCHRGWWTPADRTGPSCSRAPVAGDLGWNWTFHTNPVLSTLSLQSQTCKERNGQFVR